MDTAPLLLDRTLIRVSGPDAASFLDNLLTQSITSETKLSYAALLTPQGKVIVDMFVWRADDAFILDVASGRSADLARRLDVYKLRAKVFIDSAPGAVRAHYSAFEDSLQDPRLPDLGYRALTADSGLSSSQELYLERLIALGAPELSRDAAPDEVFAGEALLDELNGVDFQKGCFVGQENVSRMKRRGTTRKKFCPIAFEGAAPSFGAPILAGAAEVGSVRSGMAGRAMALVRLDRANAQALTAESRPVRLDPPPWLILPAHEDAPR